MKKIKGMILGLGLALAAGLNAHAADPVYPDKPIRMIIPYPAGGTTDILGRIVTEKLAQKLGQPIIVENKAGASSMIGTAQVARSTPDGYTLLLTSDVVVLNEFLYTKPSYNAKTDLKPVALVATTPYFLIVNGKLPVHSVADLVKLAKEQPGKIAFGSSGIGGTVHLVGELFQLQTGTKLLHVPYKGTGPAVTDLAAGQVQAMFVGLPSVEPFLQNHTLRLLATAEDERSPLRPELPTIKEAGFPGIATNNWFGILAPAGVPDGIVKRIAEATAEVNGSPDIKKKMAALGAVPLVSTPQQFANLYEEDRERWQKVIQQNHIKIE